MSEELKQYNGSCHCGAVKFNVQLPEVKEALYCDCSICSRNACLWAFPSDAKHVVFTEGQNHLKGYKFGVKKMAHSFCQTCGTTVKAQVGDTAAPGINVRALENIDLSTLKIQNYNGSATDPQYVQPPLLSPKNLTASPGTELHNGNCHCGAIRYVTKTKPLSSTAVISCNCSICARHGELRIFTTKSNLELDGEENLTSYSFAKKNVAHRFCRNCGVSTVTVVLNPEIDMVGVNARTMVGVDLEQLLVQKVDGRNNTDPDIEVVMDQMA